MNIKMDSEEMESLVDRIGLAAVVDMLCTISAEKAEHLRANWQDESAKASDRLDVVAHTIAEEFE